MSVVRGRPPRLAGGMSGSNRRNWSSVKARPEPKSPTSARLAGVHMAVSKQETACNAARIGQDQPIKPALSPLCKRALIPNPDDQDRLASVRLRLAAFVVR